MLFPPVPRLPSVSPLLGLVCLSVLACGGSDSTTTPPPPAPTVSSVVVTPGAHAFSGRKGTVDLSARVTASDGSIMTGVSIAWTSSDPGVATVSGTGTVSALAGGTTTVTATVHGIYRATRARSPGPRGKSDPKRWLCRAASSSSLSIRLRPSRRAPRPFLSGYFGSKATPGPRSRRACPRRQTAWSAPPSTASVYTACSRTASAATPHPCWRPSSRPVVRRDCCCP